MKPMTQVIGFLFGTVDIMTQKTLFSDAKFDESRLHDISLNFGKHSGQRLVNIPVGYLKYIVANTIPSIEPTTGLSWTDLAQRELNRRGYVSVPVSISGHAIDDFSRRGLKIWSLRYNSKETSLGIVSFLQNLFAKDVKNKEKWKSAENKSFHLLGSYGIRWTFVCYEISNSQEFEVISIWINK